MDASEYKEYIFGMLFLKRMSDQFEKDRDALLTDYTAKGLPPNLIEKQLANPDKYNFFVPENARWDKIRHIKQSIGSGLNKALEAIEGANNSTLENVLKGINFNRKIGPNIMEDSVLVEFIQHFDDIALSNNMFEFPDLLGAAYEYLIKYFADSAGKKGGEFYTPSEVVRLLVQIIEPEEGMSIYDPTVGSGGMLIQSQKYVQETGGDPRNLELIGQESNPGTWSICKMNLILHGINSSDIRHGDTLKDPKHIDTNGELRRFNRVIANPPFSQNYSTKEMKYKDRFHTFMPESGKKADLMFVQHMISVLKADGKMAVIMPHGVLFRGGEEKTARQKFIKEGVLEAVIGLPANLFYGTGIPAAVLVINKQGASNRKSILFINADREYKEGKNQNSLRPEDIEKISHVYRNHLTVEKYSREVLFSELEQEDYNFNIRRYVDNSPPPEPHDVKAHLQGGIPISEIEPLQNYFVNYPGTKETVFKERDPKYMDFSDIVVSKDNIKALLEHSQGIKDKHAQFHQVLDQWWDNNIALIEALPQTQNLFTLRRQFLNTIADYLVPQAMLDIHKVRGAFANYINTLDADFKSVSASGWNAELIPEEEILQSQFPELLEKMEIDKARITELEALFDVANDEESETDEPENGVLSKELLKSLKAEKKNLVGELSSTKRNLKAYEHDIKGMSGLYASVATVELAEMKNNAIEAQEQIDKLSKQITIIDQKLEQHTKLEDELRTLRANIREVEKNKEELITAARAKIAEDEAKQLILDRFKRELAEQYNGYLQQHRQAFISDLENLWQKYAVTMKQILAEREQETKQCHIFFMELGYEFE